MNKEEIISGIMLFQGMTEDELKTALVKLNKREKSYKKGDLILTAGSITDDIGVVVKGSVTIESNDMWGNRTVLNNVAAQGFFAETYAILKDEPLMVDAVANENCDILFLNIGGLLRGNSFSEAWQMKLTRNLLMITANKNIMLSNRSFHTSPKNARGRIQAYLNSVTLKVGSNEFDIPFDREQMADYLNLDRSALSRELSKMKSEGIINYKKNHFVIIQE
ncbi:MAG: Crp/Fnr family transcriptional regulator [Catonella sp.]|nr:Crp/Fnr family transcriptional regulator [Catonella sp.]MDY6357365.1 Crp/Fnr family transcriptional regulator [Catonella sp.]